MKINQVVCTIMLISVLASTPMAIAINRDRLTTKARSIFETTKDRAAMAKEAAETVKEKVTVTGKAAWQRMSTSALAKKASSMLKTLKKDMVCIYRWDCTREQRKRILREVSALMALVTALLIAKIALGRSKSQKELEEERKRIAEHLKGERPPKERPLTEEETKMEEREKYGVPLTPGEREERVSKERWERLLKESEEEKKARGVAEILKKARQKQIKEEMEEIMKRKEAKKKRQAAGK